MNLAKIFLKIKFVLLCLSLNISAMHEQQQRDPLLQLNYKDAFDQTKIHKKFKELMAKLSCAENVFDQEIRTTLVRGLVAIELFNEDQSEGESESSQADFDSNNNKDIKAYEQACLKKLRSARNWSITEPARESLTLIFLMVTAAVAVNQIISTKSLGGSFSIFIVLFNSVYLLRDTIRSCYNLVFQPSSALDSLEKRFATNQCFIPKVLWPLIIEKFMMARQNQFEQRKSMDFIEFILGLTIYKPRPEMPISESEVDIVAKELHARIDLFFDDYQNNSDKDQNKYHWIIKINLYKFIKSLISRDGQSTRYICLQGPGGIGKTFFVNQLCNWLEELIPDSIKLEEMVITSAQELEGDAQCPGAFLRVLRNQLMANKIGSVIFLDEATWLNQDNMISASKRVFNGDLSKISTTYFGNGIEGTGITLKMPPMLIFVAMNDDIRDEALKSRFDFITYPLPRFEALKAFALRLAKKSEILNLSEATFNSSVIDRWIENLDKQDCNFRYITANIETILCMN